jgi:hypothetical protein
MVPASPQPTAASCSTHRLQHTSGCCPCCHQPLPPLLLLLLLLLLPLGRMKFDAMSEAQRNRYEEYRRATLPRAKLKKVLQGGRDLGGCCHLVLCVCCVVLISTHQQGHGALPCCQRQGAVAGEHQGQLWNASAAGCSCGTPRRRVAAVYSHLLVAMHVWGKPCYPQPLHTVEACCLFLMQVELCCFTPC